MGFCLVNSIARIGLVAPSTFELNSWVGWNFSLEISLFKM